MTLKAVVDNLDDVPESLRGEYTEIKVGEKTTYHLDLDTTLQAHTSILPLSNSLRNVKSEKAALQTKLTAAEARLAGLPDDFDPAAIQQMRDELETLKKDPGNKDAESRLTSMREQYEQRLRAAEAKRNEELAAKDQSIAQLERELDEDVAGGGLQKALVKAGIAPEYLDATAALLRTKVKVKRDEEAKKRLAIVETDMGEVDVEKFVDNWSKSDQGKPFVVKPSGGGGQGSGSGGRSERNPWAKDTQNLTEQGAIILADRSKAERLMKAAGRTQAEINIALAS